MHTGQQQQPDQTPDQQYDVGAASLMEYAISVAPDASLLVALILEVMVMRSEGAQ